MRFQWKDMTKRWWAYTLSACIVVLFYVLLTHLNVLGDVIRTALHYCLPVIIGVAIVYVVNPLVNFFRGTVFGKIRSEKIAGRLSVTVTFLLILVIVIVLLVSLIPQLVSSVVGLLDNLDGYIAGLQSFIHDLDIPSEEIEQQLEELLSDDNGLFARGVSMLTRNMDAVLRTSTTIGSSAFNWIIGFIIAIYILMDKVRIRRFIGRFFRLSMSDTGYARLAAVWRRFNEIFAEYIVCDLLDALIVGLANYIFMKVTGMPYALLISVAVGVTNLAPTFGPIVGAVIGAFILLLVRPVLVLYFLGFTIVLQTIDGYLIKPKMFGDALNVPSILILVAIIVGGRMFGVLGILLAIPFAAILEYMYRELFLPWLKARRIRKYGALPETEAAGDRAGDDGGPQDEPPEKTEKGR